MYKKDSNQQHRQQATKRHFDEYQTLFEEREKRKRNTWTKVPQ